MNFDRIRKETRGILPTLGMVAAVTIFVYSIVVETGLGHGSVVYLIPVVIAASRWGIVSAIFASVCGVLAAAMPLHVRTWTCGCGTVHDRDVNAARNILAAGLAVSVCGDGVRPQRNTPGGQSATKQKALRRKP